MRNFILGFLSAALVLVGFLWLFLHAAEQGDRRVGGERMRKLGAGPSKLLTVRLTTEERAMVRDIAEQYRMTPSEIIRAALRGESLPVPTTERTFTCDYALKDARGAANRGG